MVPSTIMTMGSSLILVSVSLLSSAHAQGLLDVTRDRARTVFDKFNPPLVELPGITFHPPKMIDPDLIRIGPASTQMLTDPLSGRQITIPVPIPPAILNDTEYLVNFHTEYMKISLPKILDQYNIPKDQAQAKIDQALPLLTSLTAKELYGQPSISPITKRSIFGDIAGIFGDGACGIVAAAVGVPAFLYSAAIFAAENGGGSQPISLDQNFYIHPVHGDIATSGPVQVYWSATRSIGFNRDEIKGSTFNRNIYTQLQNAPSGKDKNFVSNTQLLLHEVTHVMQYKSLGYNLVRFADKYAFEICKDGYRNCALEQQAYNTQNAADSLLVDPTGNQFWQAWSQQYLVGALGFPTTTSYIRIAGDARGITELAFERGLMQIIPGNQFRTFNSEEVTMRERAKCRIQTRCRRSPVPMRDPNNPDGDNQDPCDRSEFDAANTACRASKAAWKSLEAGRPFIPFSAIPQYQPLAGCPTSCQIHPKVPRTSKSCQFDDPPAGCDWEGVEEENRRCREERTRCGQT